MIIDAVMRWRSGVLVIVAAPVPPFPPCRVCLVFGKSSSRDELPSGCVNCSGSFARICDTSCWDRSVGRASRIYRMPVMKRERTSVASESSCCCASYPALRRRLNPAR